MKARIQNSGVRIQNEDVVRRFCCNVGPYYDSVWDLDGVDLAALNAVDERIEVATVPFGCADSAEKGVVNIVFRRPVCAVQYNFSHSNNHS